MLNSSLNSGIFSVNIILVQTFYRLVGEGGIVLRGKRRYIKRRDCSRGKSRGIERGNRRGGL